MKQVNKIILGEKRSHLLVMCLLLPLRRHIRDTEISNGHWFIWLSCKMPLDVSSVSVIQNQNSSVVKLKISLDLKYSVVDI